MCIAQKLYNIHITGSWDFLSRRCASHKTYIKSISQEILIFRRVTSLAMVSSAFLVVLLVIFPLDVHGKHITGSRTRDEKCKVCGVSGYHSRRLIINGITVPLQKYPWVVPLLKSGTRKIDCAGVLISKHFVLTAAQCVDQLMPSQLKIGIMKTSPLKPDEQLEVSDIIIHPDYSYPIYGYDIALIELKKHVECNDFIRPICLPKKELGRIGRNVIIAAFGKTFTGSGKGKEESQRLREGRVKQMDPKHCLGTTSEKQEKILCTAGYGSETSCNGDSGSPAFGEFEGAFYSLGIASKHSNSRTCPIRGPVPYTKTFAYLKWIKKFVKHLPKPPYYLRRN